MTKAKQRAEAWERKVAEVLASDMSAEEMAEAPRFTPSPAETAFQARLERMARTLARASADLKRDDGGHGAALANLLRSDAPLTPAMRNALADLFSGKMTRRRGQRGASYPLLEEAALNVALDMASGLSADAAMEQAFPGLGGEMGMVPDEDKANLEEAEKLFKRVLANYLKRGAHE